MNQLIHLSFTLAPNGGNLFSSDTIRINKHGDMYVPDSMFDETRLLVQGCRFDHSLGSDGNILVTLSNYPSFSHFNI